MTSRRKPGRRAVHESAQAYDGVDPRSRVERILLLLSNKDTAEILGVSSSQPSRWKRGQERVSAASLPAVIDLDYVVSRILAEWAPEAAKLWLAGSEPHLLGARPIDVMILRGPLAVIPALDAIHAGAL